MRVRQKGMIKPGAFPGCIAYVYRVYRYRVYCIARRILARIGESRMRRYYRAARVPTATLNTHTAVVVTTVVLISYKHVANSRICIVR